MTAPGIFVTGTDTGVGKTVAASALLRALAAEGWRAVGMKPVASGLAAGEAVPEDVVAHAEAANVIAPLDARNPYRFAPPIAPHVAAREAGVRIELTAIAAAYGELAAVADAIVVEGAGGPLVPLDDRHDMLDIAASLRLPVLLVVGIRLGCLSQARLCELAIRARGLRFAGWVAARIEPAMLRPEENVASLAAVLGAPIADFPNAEGARIGPVGLARLGFRRR
jgi:dethiobiotin synthetase